MQNSEIFQNSLLRGITINATKVLVSERCSFDFPQLHYLLTGVGLEEGKIQTGTGTQSVCSIWHMM